MKAGATFEVGQEGLHGRVGMGKKGKTPNAVKVSNPMFSPRSSEKPPGGDGSPAAQIGMMDSDPADADKAGDEELTPEQKLAKYEEIFQRYDDDNSGTIESHELGNVMKEMGHVMDHTALKAMVAEIDTDVSN